MIPMKSLASSALILLVAASGCAAPSPSPTEIKRSRLADLNDQERAMMERVLKSFVLLRGSNGSGSAVAVGPDGKVLTAWHVVEGGFLSHSKDGAVPTNRCLCDGRYQDKPFSNPVLVAAWPDQDVALLDIGMPTPDYISPSARGFAVEERVFLVGASGGKAEFTECAHLRAIKEKDSLQFALDAPALPGDSGGAVTNRQGELLGVLIRGQNRPLDAREKSSLPGWTWISFMVPMPSQVFLNLSRTRTSRSGTRLFFDPDPPEGRINPEKVWGTIRFAADP
jgi:hypothetical protein